MAAIPEKHIPTSQTPELPSAAEAPSPPDTHTHTIVKNVQNDTADSIRGILESLSVGTINWQSFKEAIERELKALDLSIEDLVKRRKDLLRGGFPREDDRLLILWKELDKCLADLDELSAQIAAYRFLQQHIFSVPRNQNELLAGVPLETRELFQKMQTAISTTAHYLHDRSNFYCCLRETFPGGKPNFRKREGTFSREEMEYFDIMTRIINQPSFISKVFRDHPKLRDAIVVQIINDLLPLQRQFSNGHHDIPTIVSLAGFPVTPEINMVQEKFFGKHVIRGEATDQKMTRRFFHFLQNPLRFIHFIHDFVK